MNHHHDIALILLERSVETTKWIKPICLPLNQMQGFRSKNIEHVTMDVVGWGYTSNLANGTCLSVQGKLFEGKN